MSLRDASKTRKRKQTAGKSQEKGKGKQKEKEKEEEQEQPGPKTLLKHSWRLPGYSQISPWYNPKTRTNFLLCLCVSPPRRWVLQLFNPDLGGVEYSMLLEGFESQIQGEYPWAFVIHDSILYVGINNGNFHRNSIRGYGLHDIQSQPPPCNILSCKFVMQLSPGIRGRCLAVNSTWISVLNSDGGIETYSRQDGTQTSWLSESWDNTMEIQFVEENILAERHRFCDYTYFSTPDGILLKELRKEDDWFWKFTKVTQDPRLDKIWNQGGERSFVTWGQFDGEGLELKAFKTYHSSFNEKKNKEFRNPIYHVWPPFPLAPKLFQFKFNTAIETDDADSWKSSDRNVGVLCILGPGMFAGLTQSNMVFVYTSSQF